MEPLIGLLQGAFFALLLGAAIVIVLRFLVQGIEETSYDPEAHVADDMAYDIDEFDDGWDDQEEFEPLDGFEDFDVDNGLTALERHANGRS